MRTTCPRTKKRVTSPKEAAVAAIRLNVRVPLLLLASETIPQKRASACNPGLMYEQVGHSKRRARPLQLCCREGERTRSSPIGPAEHDEGGSL